jgi:hypothetical protein
VVRDLINGKRCARALPRGIHPDCHASGRIISIIDWKKSPGQCRHGALGRIREAHVETA